MVKYMLRFDTVRGEDSTGLLSVYKNKHGEYSHNVFKSLGTPDILFEKFPEDMPKGIIEGTDIMCLLGHNRYRTQGAITAENAHPFIFDNVIGVHNGTISAHITAKLHDAKNYEIDSQRIYSSINHDEDLQNTWKHLEDAQWSAATLSYYDLRSNSLNMIRNAQRPMFFATLKNSNTLVFASESWMITVAAAKVGAALKAEPASIATHSHIQLTYVNNKIHVKEKELTFNRGWVFQQPAKTTGYQHPQKKMINIELETAALAAAQPHAVYKERNGGKEFLVIPFVNIKEDFFEIIEAHEKLCGWLEIDEGMSWNRLVNNKMETQISAVAILSAAKEELRDALGLKEFDINYLRALLKGELEEKKPEEEKKEEVKVEEKKPSPSQSLGMLLDGTVIGGKTFRKVLRDCGNTCSSCGTEIFPNNASTADGCLITGPKEALCADCADYEVIYGKYPQVMSAYTKAFLINAPLPNFVH